MRVELVRAIFIVLHWDTHVHMVYTNMDADEWSKRSKVLVKTQPSTHMLGFA